MNDEEVLKLIDSSIQILSEYKKVFETGNEEAKLAAKADLMIVFAAIAQAFANDISKESVKLGGG